jgi:carboxyl-terminal processing protease
MHRRPSFFHQVISFGLLAIGTSPVCAASLTTSLTAEERRNLQRETLVLMDLLQGYHYSHRPFHEVNAGELLERYFSALDPERRFFLHGDTEFLRRRFERNLKTVYLFKGDLHPAFEIYDLFAKRLLERCAWIDTRLGRSFPFERDDTFHPDRDQQPRPADAKAADTLWEQALQNELIGERLRGRDLDAAISEVRRRYAERRKRVEAADPLRVREFFLNALMGLFDPHCGYFSKETADLVSGDITGAVTGIGVDLRLSDGRFLVKSLHPGGPAERAGGIHPGYEFIAFAETGAETKPLTHQRLREVVELIRGEPGTKLVLTIRAANGGEARTVELERSRMEIADNHASGLLYRVPGEEGPCAIGVVKLPAFYGEKIDETTTASMTKDVAELLAKLKDRGAEAVIVDVRDNGGGLINEAVGLSGLFIEKGPALLTRGKSGKPTILRDDDPSVAFAGPLVVLTSRHSASASEGFAGAMQAYQRALVVGETSTFGKGTMQWFVELGKTFTSAPESIKAQWGVARVTREFFYSPDGSSPQSDGVLSDVALPVFVPPRDRREKELPYALPATKIPAPEPLDTASPLVARMTPELRAYLKSAAEKRIETLPEFVLEARADTLRGELWKTGPISLKLSARQTEYDDIHRRRLALRQERRTLDADIAFPSERIELDIVAKNQRDHQATLAARRTPQGATLANRLDHDTFYYRACETAELRAVPLEKIDWDVALSHASALTEIWTRASGQPTEEPVVRAALIALKLRDPDAPTPTPAFALFRQHLGGALNDADLNASIGALLKTVAEFDVDVLLDQRPLDVHLRESVRLAADWVHWRRTHAPTAPAALPGNAAAVAGAPAASTR